MEKAPEENLKLSTGHTPLWPFDLVIFKPMFYSVPANLHHKPPEDKDQAILISPTSFHLTEYPAQFTTQ